MHLHNHSTSKSKRSEESGIFHSLFLDYANYLLGFDMPTGGGLTQKEEEMEEGIK